MIETGAVGTVLVEHPLHQFQGPLSFWKRAFVFQEDESVLQMTYWLRTNKYANVGYMAELDKLDSLQQMP